MTDRRRLGGRPWSKHLRRPRYDGFRDLDLREARRRVRRERPEDEDGDPPAGEMDAGETQGR